MQLRIFTFEQLSKKDRKCQTLIISIQRSPQHKEQNHHQKWMRNQILNKIIQSSRGNVSPKGQNNKIITLSESKKVESMDIETDSIVADIKFVDVYKMI